MKLDELDRIYRSIKDYMSVNEKISYCSKLIYRTHVQLNRHGVSLTRAARTQSLLLLQYAREELYDLMKKGSPDNQKFQS